MPSAPARHDTEALLKERLPRPLLALQRALGEAPPLYLVGGAVRDLLLGRPLIDIDLLLEGDAPALARHLARELGAKALTHPRFGTAKLSWDGFAIDLASARTETYPRPGALPVVAPGTIAQDLGRRDFTINAMALRLGSARWGELLDPCGGRRDLERGLIRTLHPASFRDDATRMLRALRYRGRLGFRLAPETEAELRAHLPFLDTISGDRLRGELELILQEETAPDILAQAHDLGVLEAIHPSLRLPRKWVRGLGEGQAPLLDFFVSLALDLQEEQVRGLAQRLRLPRAAAHAMGDAVPLREALAALLRKGEAAPAPSAVYHALKPYALPALQAWAVAHPDPRVRASLHDFLTKLQLAKPSLDGDELKSLGVPPGPAVGRMLRALLDARLDGQVSTREDEREWLQRRLGPKKLS